MPLGVGIAPALGWVLMRRGPPGMWGSPGWPLVEGPRIEGPHWASRAWAAWAWSNWTERTLDLLLDKLLGVVNLLGRTPDDEQLEVGVPVGWQLPGDLYEGSRLLVYGFHILATSADDQPTLVSGDGEGHLPTRGTPIALASSSASPPWGHAWTPWRTWGATPEALEEVVDDPGCVLAPVWGPHYMSNLLGPCPVILLELYPHASIILDLLDHLSAPANDHANRMPGHWHINASANPRSVLIPVPKAALVTFSEDVHHHLAGLLHFVRIPNDSERFVHIRILRSVLN